MVDDPIREYLEARKALKNHADRLNEIASILRHTASMLSSKSGPTIITKEGRMIPDRGNHIPPDTIDLREWPTAEDIAEAVSSVYSAVNRMRSLWRLIPPEYQEGLQNPE